VKNGTSASFCGAGEVLAQVVVDEAAAAADFAQDHQIGADDDPADAIEDDSLSEGFVLQCRCRKRVKV
jgi:hypothetical protein